MRWRRHISGAFALLAAYLAGACSPAESEMDVPPSPALWEVRSPGGELDGWLFGTIHTLPRDMDWHTRLLDGAITNADLLVVEASDVYAGDEVAKALAHLAVDPNLPPLMARVHPSDRKRIAGYMAAHDMKPGSLDKLETWAAALAVGATSGASNSGDGTDEALVEAFSDRDVDQLEGAERQLAIFDRLPEADQRDLMSAVLDDAERAERDPERLANLWRAGDIDEIQAEGAHGILGDPELRAALLVERNLDWANQLSALLAKGERPLIAVGAAHLAGSDGLPALLAKRGYTVTRIQ